VKVVSFTRNFGHQPAVSAGLRYATGDAVAVIDADLQDPPEVILRLMAKWREGYDVVNAVRESRKEGVAKRFAYALFYRMYRWLASIDVPLDSGDFALMDRRVVEVMNALPEKNRFVRGLRSWSGFRQTGVAYERQSRAAGETKYSFRKLVGLAFDGIVNFSTAPLSLIFGMGVATAFLALAAAAAYLAWRIVRSRSRLHPGEAPGFTTLILTILFFSGVQLISIGILGEYLGRIYPGDEDAADLRREGSSGREDGGAARRHAARDARARPAGRLIPTACYGRPDGVSPFFRGGRFWVLAARFFRAS
jgi:dolichol-phosphate mannosyltransferase